MKCIAVAGLKQTNKTAQHNMPLTITEHFTATALKGHSHQNKVNTVQCSMASTHHSPPEGVSVAAEISSTVVSDIVLLREVDKVRGKDQTKKADVQRRNQLLLTVTTSVPQLLTASR